MAARGTDGTVLVGTMRGVADSTGAAVGDSRSEEDSPDEAERVWGNGEGVGRRLDGTLYRAIVGPAQLSRFR